MNVKPRDKYGLLSSIQYLESGYFGENLFRMSIHEDQRASSLQRNIFSYPETPPMNTTRSGREGSHR